MTRILPITMGTAKDTRVLVEKRETRDQSRFYLGTGCHVAMRLNHRMANYAAQVMVEALDHHDYELVTIVEYALYGESTTSIKMSEIADRLIRLQALAKKRRHKKMLLLLKAAAMNAAG